MLNEPDDDKYEGSEESEYHFSDEEVSYEVESESLKQENARSEGIKENIFSQLSNSKRMLISLGVFLVLVFVVYKMVAPTTTSAPATDIAAAPAVDQSHLSAAPPTPVEAGPSQVTPAIPAGVSSQQTSIAQAVPTSPVSQPVAQAPVVQPGSQQQIAAPVVSTAPAAVVQTQQTAPVVQPVVVSPQLPQPLPQQPVIQPPVIGGGAAQQSVPVPGLPAVIPVQTTAPVYPISQQVGVASVPTGSIEVRAASLAAESERLMGQMQAQYSQQFNEFSNQNKALQEQMQSLSARVTAMESQLNQLVQALTRHGQSSSMATPPASSPEQPQAANIKIAYNVQAIIPGRAWLKSENGETLTVAEGDMIRGVGRVTKIDPYDGVVEVNTGNKAVSLSYGNGG
ncbi:MAG: hypothetical protein KIT56_01570 [Gammaproteobacteria bacterium]|nr:hypothetical protein [Gammaproteobacteria bacterium]MCW5582572.1 hypothetical protein [Gammaproteobacteria bacterium]